MKLEVGQFVRTKDGIIAKVDYIDDNTIFFDKDLYRTYGDSINFLEKDNLEKIVKASYNIIDILEKRDVIIDSIEKHEILLIDDELMVRNTGLIYDNNYYLPIKSITIKSVITHEQMEQMAYKVGE